jgi:diaminopimelate decarboxylase
MNSDGAIATSWNYAELTALAETYGTPYFLYDADLIRAQIDRIRVGLQQRVRVYYAVKANPNVRLLQALRGTADGLDISSVGELDQALAAGFQASDLSFAGPGKSRQELERAIAARIGAVSVESQRELEECASISRLNGVKAKVLLRVNPVMLNRAFGLKMGGRSVQFGIDEEEIAPACEFLLRAGNYLDFRGIHVYAGSQCFEAAGITDGVENTLRLASGIESRWGLVCRTINLGGGFGVGLGPEPRRLEIGDLARDLIPLIDGLASPAIGARELIFELGRYLTAEFGVYVCRVVSLKRSRGKLYFIVDGGLHHHLAAAGTFGAALRSNFPIVNLTRQGAPTVKCSIAGPSCNPTDLLGIDVDIPEPQVGDLLAVLKSGSYGFSASPLLFLGRPTAVELVRDRDDVVVGRRRRTMLEFN